MGAKCSNLGRAYLGFALVTAALPVEQAPPDTPEGYFVGATLPTSPTQTAVQSASLSVTSLGTYEPGPSSVVPIVSSETGIQTALVPPGVGGESGSVDIPTQSEAAGLPNDEGANPPPEDFGTEEEPVPTPSVITTLPSQETTPIDREPSTGLPASQDPIPTTVSNGDAVTVPPEALPKSTSIPMPDNPSWESPSNGEPATTGSAENSQQSSVAEGLPGESTTATTEIPTEAPAWSTPNPVPGSASEQSQFPPGGEETTIPSGENTSQASDSIALPSDSTAAAVPGASSVATTEITGTGFEPSSGQETPAATMETPSPAPTNAPDATTEGLTPPAETGESGEGDEDEDGDDDQEDQDDDDDDDDDDSGIVFPLPLPIPGSNPPGINPPGGNPPGGNPPGGNPPGENPPENSPDPTSDPTTTEGCTTQTATSIVSLKTAHPRLEITVLYLAGLP